MAIINWTKGFDKAKEDKKQELNSKCNSTILGRFSCIVNGETYHFSNDMEAQANFEKCDRAFEKGRLTEIPWTAYDTNGNVTRIVLTPETFEQVYLSHLYHIQNNIARFRDFLMPMVDDAIDEEDLKKITWEMIPQEEEIIV